MQYKNDYRIYLSPPHQSGDELDHLRVVLESNWLAPGGKQVEKFESKLKSIANREYCVALNSGTAAIHLALISLGVGPGDYVLCQTFSFVAIANPIAYLGARPVFIDSEPETWNLDPILLEKAILDLKMSGIRPKAVIYAHIYGTPAKALEIMEISRRFNIPVIEDAAEALGAKIDSRHVGQFGDISVLSFNGNKVVTTSGGGALLTDDKAISDRTLHLSSQARKGFEPYCHTEVGYNYRLSNVSAALGLAQLKWLEKWVERKREIFLSYMNNISGEIISSSVKDDKKNYSNRWLSVFLLKSKDTRDKILQRLDEHNIEARPCWKPLHLLNIYKNQKSYISSIALDLYKRGICLPSGAGLSEEEQKEVIQIIGSIN